MNYFRRLATLALLSLAPIISIDGTSIRDVFSEAVQVDPAEGGKELAQNIYMFIKPAERKAAYNTYRIKYGKDAADKELTAPADAAAYADKFVKAMEIAGTIGENFKGNVANLGNADPQRGKMKAAAEQAAGKFS